MTFGEAGKEGARVHDLKDVSAILDVFQKHGYREVSSYIPFFFNYSLINICTPKVDTALGYTGTTSEKFLGEVCRFYQSMMLAIAHF